MLNKLEILFFSVIFSFILISSLSFAAITCSPCNAGDCACAIEDCSSGILRIYPSSTCRIPTYEYTFSNYKFNWDTALSGTYYAKAFCADGKLTTCNEFSVRSSATTTSTIRGSTTTNEEPTQGTDYSWIIIVIGILIIVALVVFLFFRQKKPKKGFESLYRKWEK
jgi:hypothetical protein